MKRSNICPKCQATNLLHLSQVADDVGPGDSEIYEGLEPGAKAANTEPWRIARVENPKKKDWTPGTASAGVVESYICKACGFTEFYTRDPESIPVDGEIVTELGGEG